jgi:hypothetical protein
VYELGTSNSVIGAGVVVAVGWVVADAASVAVAPNSGVGLPFAVPAAALGCAVGSTSFAPEASAVCVAMVLKTDESASCVGVATEDSVAERVQALTSKAAVANKSKLDLLMGNRRDTSIRRIERQAKDD